MMSLGYGELVARVQMRDSLIALETNHLSLSGKCGFDGCNKVTGLKLCGKCKLRAYCCKKHQCGDFAVHKQFCHYPLPENDFSFCSPSVNDSISVNLEGRVVYCEHNLGEFVSALIKDLYPSEICGNMFGLVAIGNVTVSLLYVGINFPMHTLMYNVWKFIWFWNREEFFRNMEVADHDDTSLVMVVLENADNDLKKKLLNAFLNGGLPQEFEKLCLQFHNMMLEFGFNNNVYVMELIRRQFRGVGWDKDCLAMLAGV
jgi:hypothetical protein